MDKMVSSNWLLWIQLLITMLTTCHSSRSQGSQIDLLNEHPVAKVKVPKTPGCVFGEKFYNLEETWHPELVQTGVLYCVICSCEPMIKKGVLLTKGHVTCNDIKDQCPVVECDDPVLLPDQCCKTCPGQALPLFRHITNPWQISRSRDGTVPNRGTLAADDSSHAQEFVTVLSGISAVTQVATSAVGVGYFTLYQKTVVYTIQVLGLKKPRSLHITAPGGTVLHSEKIEGGKKDQTLCGSVNWPDVYINFLRNGELLLHIDTKSNKGGEIGGQIVPRDTLKTEVFTAVLEPNTPSGYGAVVLARLGEKPQSLHFTAITAHTEDLLTEEPPKKPLSFTLTKKGKTFYTETIYPNEQQTNYTSVSWTWEKVKKRILKFLSGEKLQMSLSLPDGSSLHGKIVNKQTCNSYWGLLSVPKQQASVVGAGGVISLQLLDKGTVKYKLEFRDLTDPVEDITLTSADSRSDAFCTISARLIEFDQQTGVVRGKCKKLLPEAIDSLLQGMVRVRIRSVNNQPLLEGNVQTILYNNLIQQDIDSPILLTGLSSEHPGESHAVGLAWLSLSEGCSLNYQLLTQGFTESDDSNIQAVLHSKDQEHTDIVTLQQIAGDKVSGSVKKLPPYMYRDLHNNDITILMATTNLPIEQISAKVRLRNKCTEHQSRDESIQTNRLPALDRNTIQDSPASTPVDDPQCVEGGQIYADGDTWQDSKDACKMCMCRKGKMGCSRPLCPEPECDKPVQVKGDCCPQCSDKLDLSHTCFYPGDERWHILGSIWHPYVPPFGFMPCAVCRCSAFSTEVNCTRVDCPVLPCPEHIAVLRSTEDCCKTCPDNWTYTEAGMPPDVPDMLGDRDDSDACMFGLEKHYNGTSWHPNVQPFGVMKCVTCICLKGDYSCMRLKCPSLGCHPRLRYKPPGECCLKCRKPVKGRKQGRRSGTLRGRRTHT